MNLVAQHLSQIGCFHQFLDKEDDLNIKVWVFREDLKSVAPCKIKVLKDLTSYVKVDIIEQIAPRELKLKLALDFCKRHLNPIHVIENKVPEDVMKIPKFNCSNKCRQFFLGLIEGMYQIYINYNLVFNFFFLHR